MPNNVYAHIIASTRSSEGRATLPLGSASAPMVYHRLVTLATRAVKIMCQHIDERFTPRSGPTASATRRDLGRYLSEVHQG